MARLFAAESLARTASLYRLAGEVKARYEADVSSYNAAMQAAARETDKLATAADRTGRTVKGMADQTVQAGTRTGRVFDGLRKNSADLQTAARAAASRSPAASPT